VLRFIYLSVDYWYYFLRYRSYRYHASLFVRLSVRYICCNFSKITSSKFHETWHIMFIENHDIFNIWEVKVKLQGQNRGTENLQNYNSSAVVWDIDIFTKFVRYWATRSTAGMKMSFDKIQYDRLAELALSRCFLVEIVLIDDLLMRSWLTDTGRLASAHHVTTSLCSDWLSSHDGWRSAHAWRHESHVIKAAILAVHVTCCVPGRCTCRTICHYLESLLRDRERERAVAGWN